MSLPERRTGLWRVAHYSGPLEFAPHDRCSWGHRFDDVERRHRTLYCASTPETALREVLADLRPNAEAIAKHRKVYGAAAAASLPKSAITEKWRRDNVLVPCTLLYEGRLLDLTDVHERQVLPRIHSSGVNQSGLSIYRREGSQLPPVTYRAHPKKIRPRKGLVAILGNRHVVLNIRSCRIAAINTSISRSRHALESLHDRLTSRRLSETLPRYFRLSRIHTQTAPPVKVKPCW